MKKQKDTNKVSTLLIETPAATTKQIRAVAEIIKGKELFQDKIETAKRTLSKLKSLPI